MDTVHIENLIAQMRAKNISFEAGLTDAELRAAQAHYGITFPPDLARFLQTALPSGERFYNWRVLNAPEIARALAAPIEGLLFDMEHNQLWLEDWGTRPRDLKVARQHAREMLAQQVKLIPIYAHRYMPMLPNTAGNPVLSVHQSDIIVYGNDLADYLCREFALNNPTQSPSKPRQVMFWETFVS